MKTHYPAIALLILFGSALPLNGQNSPNLILTDYDNTSKPFGNPDSTFCKGQTMTIHGQNFKRATSGEAWDTTIVYLGGNRIWPNYINQQNGGTNDRIEIDLPSNYPNDTCLTLELWKRTVQFPDTFLYKLYDTICVGGDFAEISYGQDTFCLGDANPFPVMQLGPNTTGSFCCFSGAASFAVFPNTGEIPLHQGAVGNTNAFQYQSNHAFCGDTISFTVAIQPRMQSHISIQGQHPNYFTCQSAPAISPDSVYPVGGDFVSYTGLVVTDNQLGKFDPQLSPVGVHRLWYRPNAQCYDSSYIDIIIDSTSTASLSYPTVPSYQGIPTLCKSGPSAFPVFTSGNVGGTFESSPSGLSLGSNGEIIPSTSQVGIYSLSYITTGPCADTVLVLPQVAIDTLVSAGFALAQNQYCQSETLNPQTANSGLWQILSSGGQVIFNAASAAIPIASAGLAGAASYGLRHIVSGACPDSSLLGFSIAASDTANFLYPPSNFCMGDADPYPLILGTGGGTFQPITASTVLGAGGRLDIAASGVGTHKIRYTTQGQCPDSMDTQVEIFGSGSALFSYAQSSFCQGDTSPIPTIQGTPGGLFSGSAGILVDTTTGAIDLAWSQAGTHNVTYSLSGNCQATFTTTIQIEALDTSSNLAYLQSGYCQDNTDPRPLISGDTIGRFIGGAGIVFSNTDKGELDLSEMQTGGPYVVTFDIDNRCADDPQDSIWVLGPDDPAFSYPALEWCEGSTNPMPDYIATNGGTFSEQTGFIQFADSTTGEINANTSQSGGPFIIKYLTAGPCPQTASAPIIIQSKPQNTSLDIHPDASYCEGHDLEATLNSIGASEWKFVLNGDSIQSQGQNECQLLSAQLSDEDTLKAITFTAEGCSDTLSEILTAIARPELIVLDSSINVNVVGLASASLIIDSDMPNAMLYWSASDQFSFNADSTTLPATISIDTLLPTRTDPFSITFQMVIKSGDCSNGRNVTLKALDLQGFFIPEVITPDGNGLNDTWQVTWQNGIDPSLYRIQLFNGAGGKVYEMNGLHKNFNGENLPDAVYWWVLSGLDGQVVQNGGLTLRRK